MRRAFVLLGVVLGCAPPANALKLVESTTPRIGKRGTTVEVSLRGMALADPREVIFDAPGIGAIAIQPMTKLPSPREYPGFKMDEEVKCRFEIAPDCSVFERVEVDYAVHIGGFERPMTVYPSGGRPGEKLAVKLLGDPLGERSADVTVPAQQGTFSYFGDSPSALGMRSSAAPNVLDLNSSGGDARRPVKTDCFIIAVTESAPFSLLLETPSAPIVRGCELVIPVKVKRRPGFEEPIDFVCDAAPVRVTLLPAETIPGDRSEAVLRVTADATAQLGSGPLMVVAYTRWLVNQHAGHGGPGELQVAAPLIPLNVAEPYLSLSSKPTSVRRRGTVEYRWTVTPKSPFAGEAEMKLLGLPKGVSVWEPLPRITSAAKEVVFHLDGSGEGLLGPATGLECEVTVNAAGQEIRQRTGKGSLRIDPVL